ncbi:MAG: right-handed parallel beta-helix repeat-containing protein [Verrucomicrobiota bacterium]|jgi:hypothetical protein
MKTNFNQNGVLSRVAEVALFLVLLMVSNPVFATSSRAIPITPQQVVLMLPPNATSTAIQSALDSLPYTGGEVDLPAGESVVTQPIVLRRDYQTLRGAGDDTILRLAASANCPVIILGEPVNHPKHNVRGLRVAGLLIDGNRRQQTRERWQLSGEGSQIRNNGITVQRVSDSVVENVTCTCCRSGGLVTTHDVRRLTVRHLAAFDNQFDGLACYQTQRSLFTDLYLHDNPGAGISLDLAFDDNVISNAVLVANDLGVFMRASRDNQFYNVTIHNSHHFGVFMAEHIHQASEAVCADNAFTNLTATNCGGAAFRVNNVSCTNNILIRAQFAKNLKGGLSLVRPNLVTVE